MRVAIYARVSTADQTTDNQLLELRQYVAARGWSAAAEYVDEGVSRAKDSRPALNRVPADARRRRFDTLVCGSLIASGGTSSTCCYCSTTCRRSASPS